jgi:hypothetical protein
LDQTNFANVQVLDTGPVKGVASQALKTPSEAETDPGFDLPELPDALLAEAQSSELNAALPAIYNELRSMASSYLSQERPNHTLQPTALVHESYLRLIEQRAVDWDNRLQVLSIAARMMRRILSSYGRARNRVKRGEGEPRLELDAALDFYDQRDLSIAKPCVTSKLSIHVSRAWLSCASSPVSPTKRSVRC